MRKRILVMVLCLGLVSAGAGILGAFSSETDAAPMNSILTTFYSDATLTQQVGFHYIGCFGSNSGGTISPFSTTEIEVCGWPRPD